MAILISQIAQFAIRKNHSSSLPTHILCFDTETKTKEVGTETRHRMDIGWSCYLRLRGKADLVSEKWLFHNDTERLWKYVEQLAKEKTILYIFGHNVFFDLQASDFFYYFTKWGWELDFWYDKAMTYILSIRKGKKRIKCLSTTNYFPIALKKLGSLVGIEKLEVDFDTVDPETLSIYCKRDVEIVKAGVLFYLQFIVKHDLGAFRPTRASQAYGAYRHRFYHTKIYIHRNEDISNFEREAYHGGRVDCYQLGVIDYGPFISLDVNSMYPYVMKTFGYPVKLIDEIANPDLETINSCLANKCIVARCSIKTGEHAYGVMHDNKFIFPVGKFWCNLCTPAIRYAVDNHHLLAIEQMYVYDKAWIFGDYVDYFYTLKKEYKKQGNKIMETLAKDMLNSLYGKFAQKRPLIEENLDMTCDGYWREETLDLVTGKTEIVTKLFNKVFIEWGEETAKNSFVAISAHVTEYARMLLWKIIKDIGIEKVLYCDTDSIKIRKRDLRFVQHPIDNFMLGALKVEDEFKQFTIHGPKDYETEKECRIKGVPRHATKISDNKFQYTNFPRQDTHLRKKITRYFITEPMIKELNRTYTKGQVDETGRVTPFELSD